MGVNDWRDKAACKGLTEDKGFDWFPCPWPIRDDRYGSQVSGATQSLLDICAGCSVKTECLEALSETTNLEYGGAQVLASGEP